MPPSRLETIDGRLHFHIAKEPRLVTDELQKELENTASDFFNEVTLQPPVRLDLPFSAYGLFKPGQLAFDSLREHIKVVATKARMKGALYERYGVPLFVDNAGHAKTEVIGALITFEPEQAVIAYQKIASIEPEKQYKWETRKSTTEAETNVLVSRSLKGACHIDDCDWDGRKDPHFKQALDLVESIAKNSNLHMGSVERLMELQMAYMLLWTAIERYASLRYHLRKKVMAKIRHIAEEPAFRDALKKHVCEKRSVYSTDAGKPVCLSPDDPKTSLDYYYQVRSNVTHRGKALMTDAVLLTNCITELSAIFRETILRAFQDCE